MKKKRIYLTVLVCIIISAMMFAYVYPFAKSEPVSGQEQTQNSGSNSGETASVGNDDSNSKDENDMNKIELNSIEELKKFSLLGGTTPELALQENEGLGIAKDFSIFAASFTRVFWFISPDTFIVYGYPCLGIGRDETVASVIVFPELQMAYRLIDESFFKENFTESELLYCTLPSFSVAQPSKV